MSKHLPFVDHSRNILLTFVTVSATCFALIALTVVVSESLPLKGPVHVNDADAELLAEKFLNQSSEHGPKVLRLTFHDALDFDGDTGGVDGCVDLSAQHNSGLSEILRQIDELGMTRRRALLIACSVFMRLVGGPSLPMPSSDEIDSPSCTNGKEFSFDAEDTRIEHAVHDFFVNIIGASNGLSINKLVVNKNAGLDSNSCRTRRT